MSDIPDWLFASRVGMLSREGVDKSQAKQSIEKIQQYIGHKIWLKYVTACL